MRTSFVDADPQALADLWNNFAPEKYALTGHQLRINLLECPTFDWGASVIEIQGGKPVAFVAVKKSSAQLYPVDDPDEAHLSILAYEHPETAIDLVAYSRKVLQDRGSTKLVFGQDTRHFFPGCPTDFSPLRDLLNVEGFEQVGEAVDVQRDLIEYQVRKPLPSDVECRPITRNEVVETKQMIGREFSPRWLHDVSAKIDAEGPETVIGLFHEGKVVGFALVQHFGAKLPANGCVWNVALGDKWGGLGPVGVAESGRGRGWGGAILDGALLHLKSLGVRECAIDWTTLIEFYGKHGFAVSRRYASMRLDLTAC